uniref:Uncharacterized protein n=1 Tax=Alexandrium andersonii TaxID=327968 RepID=A0A7S2CAZ5_9DINO|mmetsp:Transcript_36298/g.82566  ORF Transcript_36298/g.82566 Transcript_36298/m.82566 type:complete len:728 (+) Transcript_36298:64-2247(+)
MQLAMRLPALALALLLAAAPSAEASRQMAASHTLGNPIRKVVNLLQAMQKKVQEEGEAEETLYKKFKCYCTTGGKELGASISTAEAKAPQLSSDIESSDAKMSQLKEDVKTAQEDRSDAKDAMAKATAIREKEAGAFAAEKAEYDANIAAINKAVAALEKGMAGGFLQTSTAQTLRQLVNKQDMFESDREELVAFLSGSQGSGYAPSSGQITGLLKQMVDTMSKGLADATATEEAAVSAYEELMAAKKKEVGALTGKIEASLERVGELGVSIAQMKNDAEDTQEALAADKDFFKNLDESCSTKTAEWEQRVKTRADELVALADTIKVLNYDDALELFKKTLPSPAASFVQVQSSASAVRARALAALRGVGGADRARIDLIALALRGKKIGFEKVIAMIDEMVATLKTEQSDDDKKKDYCAAEFDASDDKKKGLERSISDSEAAISKTEDGIATVTEEAAALTAGIKALDKAVAEATEQRKKEHAEFTELMASDSAAKELLGFAKNRLNQFYNPKLYKPPAKRELSSEDRIVVNFGGAAPPTPAPGGIAGTGIAVLAEISAHTARRSDAAPPPPPETFGAYTKKTQQSGGVIGMMDLLIKDLDKEMQEAEVEEKDAQGEYEVLMKDSAEKRAADSKSLAEKEKAKADLEADLEAHKDAKASATQELAGTLEYISSLHAECDWLMQYFDVRKEARASEIDSLGKAKGVLSGSDYSLVQTGSRSFLRRSA